MLETVNAPGTASTINLAGAVTDRKSFASVFTNGSPCFYFLDDGGQAEWGVAVFNSGSPNTITRTTVLGNTANTTARLNFTGATRCYNEIPASRNVYIDNTNTVKLPANARVDTLAGGMPIGSGLLWYTNTAPPGYLLCGGQWISRTTYSALFATIGTTYGAADGASYFALPDLRGRVPVGREFDNGGGVSARMTGVLASTTIGAAGGDQYLMVHNHTLTINDNYHTHSVNDPTHAHAVADGGHAHSLNGPAQLGGSYGGYAVPATGIISINNQNWSTDGRAANIGIYAASTGISLYAAWAGIGSGSIGVSGAGGQQNVQPSMIVNYIIFAGV